MLINIKDLSLSYGDKVLCNKINLIVNEYDKIAIVGHNGCGKSSLMKEIINHHPSIDYRKDIKISYMPQEDSFHNDMTAFEYVSSITDSKDYEIKTVLNKFDVSEKKIKTFSGGERKRLSLAIALLKECDLLILDEPTNHLDTIMIEYLEKLLLKRKKALILVTHDRYFLERITNTIIELDRGSLYQYQGNYSQFLIQKQEREEIELQRQRKRKLFLKKELEWIRAGVQARTTKRKSRIQQFEELSSIEDIQVHNNIDMFVNTSRIGKKTIVLDHISKSYDDILFDDFSYTFKRFDRIGIVGRNGCGKSTLLNMIAGIDYNYGGSIEYGETIKIGYFRQNIEDMNTNMTVLKYLTESASILETDRYQISAKQLCQRFQLDDYMVIENLSGGEKRRLYLCKILMSAPNVLLLDEPTNDLDLETLSILEDYLDNFPGIIITVSHDRYFLDRITDGLFIINDKHMTYSTTGYSSDIWVKHKKVKKQPIKKQRKPTLTYQEKKDLENLPLLLSQLEKQIKDIDYQMNTTDYIKLQELNNQRDVLSQELEEKEILYMNLLEKEESL